MRTYVSGSTPTTGSLVTTNSTGKSSGGVSVADRMPVPSSRDQPSGRSNRGVSFSTRRDSAMAVKSSSRGLTKTSGPDSLRNHAASPSSVITASVRSRCGTVRVWIVGPSEHPARSASNTSGGTSFDKAGPCVRRATAVRRTCRRRVRHPTSASETASTSGRPAIGLGKAGLLECRCESPSRCEFVPAALPEPTTCGAVARSSAERRTFSADPKYRLSPVLRAGGWFRVR